MKNPHIPISWGELFDKITILQIKSEKILSPASLKNIDRELKQLSLVFDKAFTENSLALKLAEDINNSDLPPGALNLLSGDFSKILDDASRHVEINTLVSYMKLNKENLKIINENASTSVKRVFHLPSEDGLSSILPFIETKTVWHPKGT